ncbi:MAG: TonB-dependent receptor [Holophagaceae bacterium]|nr:TonB-dependent receptor [Holophagaceae bacterium]
MFRTKSILGGSALAFALVSGGALIAQETTGSLSGQVKDGKGAPIVGATITVDSPALFSPRVLKTNDRGVWRAPLLPPGNYKVTAVKEGFITSGAKDIRIGLGSAQSQDLTLKSVSAAAATVEVVATAATVDKSDTKAASNFSSEDLVALPGVDRSFYGAADLAPGLTSGRGGSFSIRGGATQNTNYRVNGVDVKDDYQGDLTGTFVIEDNIEDVQVILSPLNARNGRATGGSVNVITKSGGNDFKGSIRSQLSRSSWNANNASYTAQAGETNDNLNRQYQVTLSGPIWKDKIWFSVGTILQPQTTSAFKLGSGTYPTTAVNSVRTGIAPVDALTLAGPAGYSWTKFQMGAPYTRTDTFNYYEGKITGALSTDHTLEASFTKSNSALNTRNPFGDGGNTVLRLAALGKQTEDKNILGLGYKGVLSSNLFIEAHYNKVTSEAVFPVGDPAYGTGEGMLVYGGSAGTSRSRQGFGYPFGFGITPTPDARNNRSGNVNVKWFKDLAGSHEMDFGYDYYESVRGTSRASGLKNEFYRIGGAFYNSTTNSYLFQAMNNVPNAVTGVNRLDPTYLRGAAPSVMQQTGKDGITRNRTDSLYLNDQWTISQHWNFMLGLRYDKLGVKDTDGVTLGKASDISPRMQLRYDLNGDSKHLFTATAARYGGDFTTGFTDAFIKKADAKGVYRGWSAEAQNPGVGVLGTDVRFVDYATLTNIANYNNVLGFFDNSKSITVAGDLRAPYLDEYTLGYKRSYDNGSRFSMTYVHRQWKKDWAFSQDYLASEMVTLTDPTGSGLPNQQAQKIHVFNSDKLNREYNGLELEWIGKINPTWTWGGNYTYSRLVGNNNGGDSNSGQSFRDNAPTGYYQNRIQLLATGRTDADFAPTGPLLQDQTQRARVYMTATLPLSKGQISYSWLLRYDSGNNYSAANSGALGFTSSLPAPAPSRPGTYTQYYGGRGQYSYNDTYQVDFKIAFKVPLALWRAQLIGDLQINNVFNTQMVYSFDTSMYTGSAVPVLYVNDATTFGTTQPGSGLNYFINARSVAFSLGIQF